MRLASLRSKAGHSQLVFLIRNTGLYTFGNFLPQVVNVLLLPVFTRYLTQAEYGILAYTTSLNAFLFVVGSFSIHSYILRRWFDIEDEEEKRRLFGTIFIALIIYNLALLLGAMLIMPPIFEILGVKVEFEPYVKLALLVNFVNVVGILTLTHFRVRQQAGRFVSLTMSQVLLATVFSLYFVVSREMGVLGRYYGLLLAAAFMLVIYIAIIIKISRFGVDRLQLKNAVGFSAPLLLSSLLYSILNMSDRLILERYVTLSQMGLYSVGFTIGSGLSILSNGVYKALEPEIFKLANHRDFNEILQGLKWIVELVLLSFGLVMIALAREVVSVLTGPGFDVSFRIVQLIVVAMVFKGTIFMVSSYLLASYKVRHFSYVTALGAITSVALNVLLIPELGIIGASIAAIVSNIVMLYAFVFVTERGSTIRWNFGRSMILVAVVCLTGLGISDISVSGVAITGMIKLGLISPLLGWIFWRILSKATRVLDMFPSSQFSRG